MFQKIVDAQDRNKYCCFLLISLKKYFYVELIFFFRGRFSVPIGAESDEGGIGKIVHDAKNAPYSKIRANFGVLSIK